jgi:hypothetical protein
MPDEAEIIPPDPRADAEREERIRKRAYQLLGGWIAGRKSGGILASRSAAYRSGNASHIAFSFIGRSPLASFEKPMGLGNC